MTAFKSAFEGAWPSENNTPSAVSEVSSVSDEDGTRTTRIVGFQTEVSSDKKGKPNEEITRFASCTLDERPTRQSSLARQLSVHTYEPEKPKLRTINVKAPGGRGRGRRSTPTSSQPTFSGIDEKQDFTDGNEPFGFPQTLPSSGRAFNLRRENSLNTDAVDIPRGLTKAYTAPEPLPELSPELLKLFGINDAAGVPITKAQTPERSSALRQGPPSATSTTTNAISTASSTSAAERGALAQVYSLREALQCEQEEVARLRRELAQLSTQQQQQQHQQHQQQLVTFGHSVDGGGDTHMVPVTPGAATSTAHQHQPPYHHLRIPSSYSSAAAGGGGGGAAPVYKQQEEDEEGEASCTDRGITTTTTNAPVPMSSLTKINVTTHFDGNQNG